MYNIQSPVTIDDTETNQKEWRLNQGIYKTKALEPISLSGTQSARIRTGFFLLALDTRIRLGVSL